MELRDINQSWTPPAGYKFFGIRAVGSYLLVEYRLRDTGCWLIVTIYVNDQGREVERTLDAEEIFSDPELIAEPPPVGWWFRFKNGFYLALFGLQEMLACHKR